MCNFSSFRRMVEQFLSAESVTTAGTVMRFVKLKAPPSRVSTGESGDQVRGQKDCKDSAVGSRPGLPRDGAGWMVEGAG